VRLKLYKRIVLDDVARQWRQHLREPAMRQPSWRRRYQRAPFDGRRLRPARHRGQDDRLCQNRAVQGGSDYPLVDEVLNQGVAFVPVI